MFVPDFRRRKSVRRWRSWWAQARQSLQAILGTDSSQDFVDELCELAPVGPYAAMADQMVMGRKRHSQL